MNATCSHCGHPLSCAHCAASRAGKVGGRTRTPARVAAAQAASKAPRPGRRAYDVTWTDGSVPARLSLSRIQARARERGVGASILQSGRVVGSVLPDGTVRMRRQ